MSSNCQPAFKLCWPKPEKKIVPSSATDIRSWMSRVVAVFV